MYMATHVLDIHICKLIGFSFAFITFFHGIVYESNLNKPISKQRNIDAVILVNTCIVAFICVSIQVMKFTINSLSLQRQHLPDYYL